MFTLGQAQIGEKLKLYKTGCVWTVFEKKPAKCGFNAVIVLKNNNGTFRTYSEVDKKWKGQVWYV